MNSISNEVVHTFPIPALLMDTEEEIIQANRLFKEIVDLPCEHRPLHGLVTLVNRGEHFYHVKIHAKTYLLYVVPRQDGYTLALLCEGMDFDWLLERMKELNMTNRELDTIIENSFDGIYITDAKGNTLRTNSAIERITGIPKEYYHTKNISYLQKRGILKASVTDQVLKEGKTVSLMQRNRQGRQTLLTGTPVFNEEGEIEKVVTNLRDLTELNRMHEELSRAQTLTQQYKEQLEKMKAFSLRDSTIIVRNRRMVELYQLAERLAKVNTTILVLGETGVGKDVFAQYLFAAGPRSQTGELVKVNCGAIPKELLESELFGYERGAFSGANKTGKKGLVELADQGVLFLDEIAEMPLGLQVKLLRVLQDKEVHRLGSVKPRHIDVQIVAATNRDLKKMVGDGTFREDLYYRLYIVPVTIPPLRERREDILPILQSLLVRFNEKYEVEKKISSALQQFLYNYHWPGNLREMGNLVERLVLTVAEGELGLHHLPVEYRNRDQREGGPPVKKEIKSLKQVVEEAEYQLLAQAVQEFKTTYEIAEHLKTSQATIVRKLNKYNLPSPSST
ncbi:sigma-54 interaction domain-containing protein [Shouchella shacheensis]|uniref:sigma-54 interaction domain-containing protein n=1 Tax=Shouchella shacheensis TaxID=1649580 RepID=UPI0007403DDF|nr:sigma 54-interacting transcriptional regulator [Shouchella shacheensis]